MRLRFKGLGFPEIAAKLGHSEQALGAWDEEIRTNSGAWRKAFLYLNKTSNRLSWEMKGMDRFYELWGRREDTAR